MALKVWLPLNGSLENKGISNVTVTNNGATVNNNGKIGKCYSFNGNSNRISCSAITCIYPISISGWFKPADVTNTNTQYWISYNTATGGTSGHSIAIGTYQGKIAIWYGGAVNNSFSTSISNNIWYHITLTISENKKAILYINGEQIYSKTFTTAQPASQWITLGARSNSATGGAGGASYYYNGLMNDFRFYDHCLSPLEVKEISQGLVLHYKLDGLSGGVGENILTGTNYNSYSSSLNATTATNANGKWCGGSGGNGTFSVIEDSTCPVGNLIWNISNNTSGNRDFQQGNQPYVSGQQYTTSFWAKGNGTCLYRSWNSTDGKQMFSKTWTLTSDWAYYTHTFTASAEMETDLCTFHLGVTGNSNISICGMKMEKGSIATPWTPAPEDLGIDITKVLDSSGYGRDGIQNNVTIIAESDRYNNSTNFNGTDSYIKVPDNSWMSQGLEALTVNLWAKATTWPTNGGRLLSCTETGGFNLEGGSSGYWRFPIHVYTNAEKTSTAYKYDSKEIQISALTPNDWNMITLVYDTTGTKTYINGQLHHTYTNTSYGIHFNTNARLFLGCEANTANPGGNYFNGQESDFRIYATALSAEDILDLYHTPANIDNLGRIHGFEFVEDNSIKIFKNGIINNKGLIELPNITEGYEILQYLDMDVNSYFNTEYSGQDLYQIDCKMEDLGASGKSNYWFGQTQSHGTMMFNGLYNRTSLEYNWTTVSWTSSALKEMYQTLSGSNIIIQINDEIKEVAAGNNDSTGNFLIGACNNVRYYGNPLRFYWLKMHIGNNVIHNYFPCIRNSDNTIGLYDTVTKTFIAKSGSGTLTAGPKLNISFDKKDIIRMINFIEK